MDARVEAGKICFSSIFVMLVQTIHHDESTKLLAVLLGLMIFDTVTGNARAKKIDDWYSYKAKWGVLGKIFQLGIISLAYGFSWALDFPQIKYWFIVYFCLVEVGSILENTYAFGVPIPKGAVDMASKGKYFFGYIFVEGLKNLIESVTKVDFNKLDEIAQKEQEKEKEEKEKEQENKGENK